MYTIEKDVPIPPKRSSTSKYPFPFMEVGDSFSFPVSQLANVRAACVKYKETYNNHSEWTFRKFPSNIVRVWRLK